MQPAGRNRLKRSVQSDRGLPAEGWTDSRVQRTVIQKESIANFKDFKLQDIRVNLLSVARHAAAVQHLLETPKVCHLPVGRTCLTTKADTFRQRIVSQRNPLLETIIFPKHRENSQSLVEHPRGSGFAKVPDHRLSSSTLDDYSITKRVR